MARILEDNVSIIALAIRGKMARDIETVSKACPAVLRQEFPNVAIYRVNADDACLRAIALP